MADDAAICPQCDHIIDASFLEGPSPKKAAAKSGPRPAAKGPRPAGGGAAAPGPGKPRPASAKPAGARAGGEVASGRHPKASGGEGDLSRPPRRESSTRPPRPAPPPAQDEDNTAPGFQKGPSPAEIQRTVSSTTNPHGVRIQAPEEALGDMKEFVLELPPSDKIAFLGSAASLIFAFLPWKDTATEGDVIGLVSLGFLAVVASIVCMSAIVIRTRKVMPNLAPLAPWLIQLGSVCFAIIWCLIFIGISWDTTKVQAPIGNLVISKSAPSMGVFLALIANCAALAGTLMGLREKPA